MNEDALLSRRDGLIEAEVDGEIVALHLENGTCYGFNPTATRLWRLLESPATLGRVCDTLAGEYRVGRDECARDLEALVAELESEGLLSVAR